MMPYVNLFKNNEVKTAYSTYYSGCAILHLIYTAEIN